MTGALHGRLLDERSVTELRDLCSELGVSRPRGATKAETAAVLVSEEPAAVAGELGEEIGEYEPPATVHCPCGLEEEADDVAGGIERAKSHLSDCKEGLSVGGLGGLSVWDGDAGARAWAAGDGRLDVFAE